MDIVNQNEEGTTYRMAQGEIDALKENPVIHCPLCPVPIPAHCPYTRPSLEQSE